MIDFRACYGPCSYMDHHLLINIFLISLDENTFRLIYKMYNLRILALIISHKLKGIGTNLLGKENAKRLRKYQSVFVY